MYIFIFYTLMVSIFISLFLKFNPNFVNNFNTNIKNLLSEEQIVKKTREQEVLDNIKKLKKQKQNNNLDNNLEKNKKSSFEVFESRGDFYFKQNFIELAVNEYNLSILEIKNLEKLEKTIFYKGEIFEAKKRIFEKIYKNQSLIGEHKKAEKNILNLISISSNEDFLFDLIRNKINQNDLKKAQLILNRIKNQNYKFFYFDFILNLNLNEGLNILEKKYKKLNFLTLQSKDKNYKAKVLVLNSAIEEFKSYRDSKNIHLYTLIGKSLTNSFEFEVSDKILLEVLKERGDYRDARIIFAYNKIRQGEPEKGLLILTEAEKIDPLKPEIQFYKAFAYEDLGNSIKAKQNFLTALKNGYNPRSQIYQKLANLYFKEGNFEKSVEFYKKMLSLNSDDIKYFLLPFDIAVEKQKDFTLAFKIANWANKRHPQNGLSNSILGYSYFLNLDFKNAKSFLKKSFELNKDLARNYLYFGEIALKEGDFKNALKYFEIAYKKDKNGKIGNKAIKFYNKISE